MIKVLFVCHANICRSPMAEGVFNYKVQQAGLSESIHADSAGVSSVHAGSPPHPGTLEIFQELGIEYSQIARTLIVHDFHKYNYIYAMDKSNLQAIRRLQPRDMTARIAMFLDYASLTTTRDLEDPCFTERFQQVYQIVDNVTANILRVIQIENQLP